MYMWGGVSKKTGLILIKLNLIQLNIIQLKLIQLIFVWWMLVSEIITMNKD